MKEYEKLTTNQIKSLIYNTRKLIAKFKGRELMVYHYQRKIQTLNYLIERRKNDKAIYKSK